MRAAVVPLIAMLNIPAFPAAEQHAAPSPASYTVELERIEPPAFKVTATWPHGSRLDMETTRPGDLPVLLERGWPAFVTDLRVSDAGGRTLETTPDGPAGWLLPHGAEGPFHAEYRVDTTSLAESDWPAPREAVFTDDDVISIVGRALFVTTDTLQGSTVTFELPPGWQPHPPWNATGAGTFRVESPRRLRGNLIAFTRRPPTVLDAGRFRLVAVLSDPWRPLEPQVRQVLGAHARRFVELMAFTGQETYVAVLLPVHDQGAESYGQSFALTFPAEPSRANRTAWANLIGHELFHYWNGWRLRGAEYAPSQWFQEGFTEYAANVSTVAAGFMSPAEFRDTLATHVENHRRLETSLEQPGTTKGPPIYSAGALVAFTLDVSIREATAGSRGLDDFLRALWRRSDGGERPYTLDDIVAALSEAADGDWTSFLDRHVRGTEPLPLQATFARVGLRLVEQAGGKPAVVEQADAGSRAKRTWRAIVSGE